MDIDSILTAIDSIDQARDEAARRRINLITRANGSHIDIEGSTGESEFSNSQPSSVAVPEFGKNF